MRCKSAVLKNFSFFGDFFLCIYLVVQEKAIPLHSLSGSNAVASLTSKMILDNIPYRQAVQCVFGFFLEPKVKK